MNFAIPFEKLFTKRGIFVLDEFDEAISPELIKGIIALFNDQSVNKKEEQFIFKFGRLTKRNVFIALVRYNKWGNKF